MRGFFRNPRRVLIVVHDLVATAAAILATLYVRFEDVGLEQRYHWLVIILPAYLVYAGVVYWFFRLYIAKWRFASLPDLWNIFRAVTVLAFSLLVLDYVLVAAELLRHLLLRQDHDRALLVPADVFSRRAAHRLPSCSGTRARSTMPKARQRDSDPGGGRAADAEVLLRAIESGAVKKIRPVGDSVAFAGRPRPGDARRSGAGLSTTSKEWSPHWRPRTFTLPASC